MGRLQDEANAFRLAVNARDTEALSILVSRYEAVWNALLPQVKDLAQRIEQRRKEGLPVSANWLYREERYKALLSQIATETAQASRFADEQTRSRIAQEFTQATADAESLLSTATGRSIGTWNRLPLQAMTELIAVTQPNSPVSALFSVLPKQTQAAAKQTLLQGIAEGHNPRKIARNLRQVTDYSAVRAATIARTEALRAYRSAASEVYRANDDAVLLWMWLAALSGRTCPVCLALHGKKFPLKKNFGSHPNCRCTQIPITEEDTSIQSGEEWFAEQDVKLQQKVLGKGKYKAYTDGRISLTDLVGEKDSKAWGETYYEKSLKDALKGK